ncbi:hypothetical protein [Rhodococcus sp. 1168]|uniref:hypothetical protein n=1 Tax=Rhodococcus sp. 1168 TaxID=2018041 RepID=UPI000A09AEED|nr:hypothetical protein [Rhodococcus sp. 1168]ORI28142.1 hypothetical protein BJI47_00675 [Rhodococcus sp. 1168]
METLAALEHERWSHWQRYMHSKCEPAADGSLTIPAELVARWAKQMTTDYGDLPKDQCESDREQVRRYLPVIDRFVFGDSDDDQRR